MVRINKLVNQGINVRLCSHYFSLCFSFTLSELSVHGGNAGGLPPIGTMGTISRVRTDGPALSKYVLSFGVLSKCNHLHVIKIVWRKDNKFIRLMVHGNTVQRLRRTLDKDFSFKYLVKNFQITHFRYKYKSQEHCAQGKQTNTVDCPTQMRP